MATNTPLLNKFTFWIFEKTKRQKNNKDALDGKETNDAFDDNLIPITTFSTINEFWEIFTHMKKPDEFEDETDVYLFREGIKPLWEDPHNQRGGYYTIKLEKSQSSKVWENMVLAFVAPIKGLMSCINGIRIKAKEDLITMQIWMNATAQDHMTELKQSLKDNLQITDEKVFMFFLFDYHLKKFKINKDTFKQKEKDFRSQRPINKDKKAGSFYTKRKN